MYQKDILQCDQQVYNLHACTMIYILLLTILNNQTATTIYLRLLISFSITSLLLQAKAFVALQQRMVMICRRLQIRRRFDHNLTKLFLRLAPHHGIEPDHYYRRSNYTKITTNIKTRHTQCDKNRSHVEKFSSTSQDKECRRGRQLPWLQLRRSREA